VEDNEVPMVAYIGIGKSELNEQILLQNMNEKKGLLGQGYYFTNFENAEYDALYKEVTDDNLIRLENKKNLTDKDFMDTTIHIKDHTFYHYANKLGKVPYCNETLQYFIYYYDSDVIYLKSIKPNQCKKEIKLREESGYVMRYVMFLKNHSIGKSNNRKKINDQTNDGHVF
jgi:hypothetical protein